MLVTDLSDSEIVLGKLASRLATVFGLLACGVPVTALAALLGGIDFDALAGSFVVSLALAVLGCVLALSLSVWATKVHEVLMAVYVAEGLWLLALPIWWGLSFGGRIATPPAWFQKANPYVLVFAPYNQPGFAGPADVAAFIAAVLAISAALLALSIARLRRVVVAQAGRPEKASRRWPAVLGRLFPTWTGPTLDGNPVLWREWHRNRPSKLARRLWAGLLLVTWALAAWGAYVIAAKGLIQGPNPLVFALILQLLFGFLMVSATAPTVLAEERVRGSLDVLLATPLSTPSIVVAKWWGAYRRVLLLAFLPLFAGIFLAASASDTPKVPFAARFPRTLVPLTAWDRTLGATFCVADFLASGALLVSLGVALATWVPRLGRAVALGVIAYFLVGIGWLPLVEALRWRIFPWLWSERWLRVASMSLSPIFGPIQPIEEFIQFAWEPRTPVWLGIGVGLLIKSAVAGMLLWLTVRTFDRRLGRIPESRPPSTKAPEGGRPSRTGIHSIGALSTPGQISSRAWNRPRPPGYDPEIVRP